MNHGNPEEGALPLAHIPVPACAYRYRCDSWPAKILVVHSTATPGWNSLIHIVCEEKI